MGSPFYGHLPQCFILASKAAFFFGELFRRATPLPSLRQNLGFVGADGLHKLIPHRHALPETMVIPDGAKGQPLGFLEQGQATRGIASPFQLPQHVNGFQQGQQQRALHVTPPNHPGRHPIDAGIKIVQTDVHPVQIIPAHQLLGDRFQLIR